jgi:hypothetical protein
MDTRHSELKLPRDALRAFCEKTKTCGRGFSVERPHLANVRPAKVGVSQRDYVFYQFPVRCKEGFVARRVPRVSYLVSINIFDLMFCHVQRIL